MTYTKINDLLLHNQGIQSELEAAARRVIASGWFALGPEVETFEKNFASWCGVSYCRGLANGTDAIELALRAVGVQPGSEVIVAANAGMYSGTAIHAIGAKPVYADIDPETFNISPVSASSLVTQNTRAIIATHLYGQLCDVQALRALADQHGIALVEDCAQAHGASLQTKKAGSFGDIAAFSFYPTKNLGALGDGGAVVTSRKDLFDIVTQLRQYGWESRYKVVRRGGCNSRLDELQAAFLNVKLPHLDKWTNLRRKIGQRYAELIRHPAVQIQPYAGDSHVYHLYVIRCNKRDDLKAYLTTRNIASDIHYPYLDYQQPVFSRDAVAQTYLPHSEQLVKEILTLPCYPELAIFDVEYVAACINEWTV